MNGPETPNLKAYNIASAAWYEFQLRIALSESETENPDPLSMALTLARKKADLFTGKEVEFEALLAELSQRQYKDNKELIEIFAREISEFAQKHFSLQELEQRARAPERLKDDEISLNETLYFNLGRNDPRKIKLHIKPASTLPMAEKLRDFRSGLVGLARLLKEDARFSQVNIIMARSWIVLKNPGIFEKLGFKILDENEKDRIYEARRAAMNREDFEKKYGNVT